MSTLSVINIQGQSAATLPVFQDSTGVEYGRLCRAFVNFNGSTASVNRSFNVSSITKNATGDYTLNFTNSLSNANYSLEGSAQDTGSYFQNVVGIRATVAPTINNVRIIVFGWTSGTAGLPNDANIICCSVHL